MLAFHKPVPASREATSTWRCAVHDLLSRKFGDWHAWLLPGRDGAEVPPPPRSPPGGSLYEVRVRVRLGLGLTLTPTLTLTLTLTLTQP